MNIYQRLLKVMEAVSYVQKEDKKVNGQYTFVSHDAVTAKIRPHLIANGVLAITRVKGHSQDGNRTEVDIELEFVNVEKPDDKIVIPAFGYGIDPQDKGPGKAISYAVKYAFLKALSLETGDDPERGNEDHKPEEKKKPFAAPHKPVDGSFESLLPERQVEIRDMAIEVIAHMRNEEIHKAWEIVSKLEVDDKVAFWSQISKESKIRSALKAYDQEQREGTI